MHIVDSESRASFVFLKEARHDRSDLTRSIARSCTGGYGRLVVPLDLEQRSAAFEQQVRLGEIVDHADLPASSALPRISRLFCDARADRIDRIDSESATA